MAIIINNYGFKQYGMIKTVDVVGSLNCQE